MLACSLLQDFEFDIALWSSFVSFLVFIGIVLLSDYNPEAKGVADN